MAEVFQRTWVPFLSSRSGEPHMGTDAYGIQTYR